MTRLYLPESWANDPVRRREACIPDGVQFASKSKLALGMLERAVGANIPGELLLTDSAYGDSNEFRQGVRALGLGIAVGIRSTTKVRRIGAQERLGKPMTVGDLAKGVPRHGRRKLSWREGTKTTLSGRFSFCRVKPTHDDGIPLEEREPLWLIIEWPLQKGDRLKFYLSSLPRRFSHKTIIRIIKERWRTERMYEDIKGELGLDHFEGHSFRGWHHHVSVVICCYAFVVAEKVRAFPPSARRQTIHNALSVAA